MKPFRLDEGLVACLLGDWITCCIVGPCFRLYALQFTHMPNNSATGSTTCGQECQASTLPSFPTHCCLMLRPLLFIETICLLWLRLLGSDCPGHHFLCPPSPHIPPPSQIFQGMILNCRFPSTIIKLTLPAVWSIGTAACAGLDGILSFTSTYALDLFFGQKMHKTFVMSLQWIRKQVVC